MHKLELEYADTISAREINRLLSSFWGRNSPIAQYNDLSIVSYNKAMSITESAAIHGINEAPM